MLNIHHLELFYYVATHGGISRAVRSIPYGIQQPAVSGQMTQLEDSLGTRLFERTPFKLTPAGEELYGHIAPFFNALPSLAEKIKTQARPTLRIGASEMTLKHYMPPLIAWLKQREPKLRLSLRSGNQAHLEQALDQGSLDLAITTVDSKPNKKIRTLQVLSLPLVLVVHKNSPIRSAEDLWAKDPIEETLICLPESESITKIFQRHLTRLRINWPVSIEAGTLEAVSTYVASGYGVGLSADIGRMALHPDVRLIPLGCAEQLETSVMWTGSPEGILAELIELIRLKADAKWQQAQLASAQAAQTAAPTKPAKGKKKTSV